MIDIQNESVVTFTEATKALPTRPHLSQLYRWAERGIGGVKLEYIQMAGKRCTSHEALQRFFSALTNRAASQPRTRTRSRTADSAKRELVAAGFEVGGGGMAVTA